MAEEFGFGIVGAGLAAAPHFRSLTELTPDISVRGVLCRSDACRAMAMNAGFPPLEEIDELLADPKLDGLLILTPPDARLEFVRAAASAGKHVLLEKPIERNAAAAAEIVDICNTAGVTLGVVLQHRFREAAEALRRILDSGRLGTIGSVALTVPLWRPQSYYDEPGRGSKARDGGGVLLTEAIHMLDLMLWMAGPVKQVQAMSGTTMHRMETEDFAAAALKFENGALGSVMATTASYPGQSETLVLNCTEGTAVLDGGLLTLHWRKAPVEVIGKIRAKSGGGAGVLDSPHIWHHRLIADFVSAVKAKRQPRSNGASAMRAHYLIDAILQSSVSGMREAVGP